MNKEEIVSVLKDLYDISGFRVSLHGIHYEEIAAYPKKKLDFCAYVQEHGIEELERCRACDAEACKRAMEAGETVIYKCRHGLVEAISPLYNFGALTGFMIMGQIREESDGISKMLAALHDIGCEDTLAQKMCENIPSVKREMVSPYVHITMICAKYLTISNALTTTKLSIAKMAMKYISENYSSRISIQDICREIGYSKSTVLTSFKKEYGETVNNYLNNIRLSHAKRLLDESEMTVNEIAMATGFSDQSYFSKMFSARYKKTPTEYRKEDTL